MADEYKTGAEAITAPKPKAPYVIPRLVRGEDGMMHTVYINPENGEVVTDLKGYSILSAADNYPQSLGTPGSGTSTEEDEKDTPNNPLVKPKKEPHESDTSRNTTSTKKSTIADNFGYRSKPGLVSLAGALPGAAGLAGKAVNAAWNANNSSAVAKGRDVLGLDPLSTKENIKSVVRDNKGHVADVKVNNTGKQYSVGYEALSPAGRTNLTVTEANNRRNQLGGVTEIEKRGAYTGEGAKKGFVEKVTGLKDGWLGDKLGSVFGSTKTTGSPMERITGKEKGWAGDWLDGVFGDKKKTPEVAKATLERATGPVTLSPKDPTTGKRTITDANGTVLSGPAATASSLAGGMARNNPAIDYSSIGGNRPGKVASSHEKFMSDAAARVAGPGTGVRVTSGNVTPQDAGWTAEGGKYSRSDRHTHQQGADVQFTDPKTGKTISDPGVISDIAMAAAAANPDVGLGYGKAYMGDSTIHIDQSGKGGSWGGGWQPSGTNISNIDFARQTGIGPTPREGVPTPTSRPDPSSVGASQRNGGVTSAENAGKPNSLNPVGSSLDPVRTSSVFDKLQPADSYGKSVVSNSVTKATTPGASRFDGFDVSKASPADLASRGMTQRSIAQKEQLAKTFAGELSPGQLDKLAKNDPIARAELGSMLSTVENRVQSTKLGGNFAGAFPSSQYNSLGVAQLGTTNNNYSKYKDVLMSTIDDFYKGNIPQAQTKATNYHNPDISNPDWSKVMTNPAVVGDHKFGSLNNPGDWPTSDAFNKERDALAKAQRETTRGWTPETAPNQRMTTADQYKSYGQGRDSAYNGGGGAFSTPSPNAGMSKASQYASYGAGKTGGDRPASSASTGKASAHSVERERDTSLGSSSAGKTSGSSGKTSSGGKSSVGGSPTNDGGGKAKSPGGGF